MRSFAGGCLLVLAFLALVVLVAEAGRCRCVDCKKCGRSGKHCKYNAFNVGRRPKVCGYGGKACYWDTSYDACNGKGCPKMARWMARLPDSTKVADLSVPGTHDTCTDRVSGASLPTLNAAKCQSWSLRTQLDNGIRFVDIRVGKNQVIYHGSFSTKYTLSKVLTILKEFVRDHPSEFVIMRVKKEGDGNAGDYLGLVARRGINKFDEDALRSARVGDVRGQVLYVNLDDISSDRVQDFYGVGWNLNAKKRAVEKHWKNVANKGGLSFNHVSGATLYDKKKAKLELQFPFYVAKSLNKWVLANIEKYDNAGVMIFDFPSTQVIRSVISCNNFRRGSSSPFVSTRDRVSRYDEAEFDDSSEYDDRDFAIDTDGDGDGDGDGDDDGDDDGDE